MTEIDVLNEIVMTLRSNQQEFIEYTELLRDEMLESLSLYNTFFAIAAAIIIFLLVVLVVRSM